MNPILGETMSSMNGDGQPNRRYTNRWSERDRPRRGMLQDRTEQTQWSDEKHRAQPHSTVRARGRRASDVWPMLLRAPPSYPGADQRRTSAASHRESLALFLARGPTGSGESRRTRSDFRGFRPSDVTRDRVYRTPRTNKPWGGGRGRGRGWAYRDANGPSLLTKQAQHVHVSTVIFESFNSCCHCNLKVI